MVQNGSTWLIDENKNRLSTPLHPGFSIKSRLATRNKHHPKNIFQRNLIRDSRSCSRSSPNNGKNRIIHSSQIQITKIACHFERRTIWYCYCSLHKNHLSWYLFIQPTSRDSNIAPTTATTERAKICSTKQADICRRRDIVGQAQAAFWPRRRRQQPTATH